MIAIEPDDIEIESESFRKDQENPDFPKWENLPTLPKLKQDLSDSQSDSQAHKVKVDAWLNNLNIEGSAVKKKVTGKSNVQPKLIRKQAEWRYAALSEPFLSTDDVFNVAPVTFEDKEAAEQNALVLNHQFNNRMNKVAFIDELVRTDVDEGTVILRVGWESKTEEVEVTVDDYEFQQTENPQMIQMHEYMHRIMITERDVYDQLPEHMRTAHDLTMEHGVPFEPIKVGDHTETETKETVNQPTVEICDYRNLTIDPSCKGDLNKAKFIIYDYETSLSDLTEEGNYFNLDKINPDSNSVLNDPDHETDDDSSFNFSDKPRKIMVAYEYWGLYDIHDTGILVPIVVTWIGHTIIQMRENPFPDRKHPFIGIQYLPKRRSVYGEPDGELLKSNQDIVGAVWRGMIDIMARSANGQIGSRLDALDISNRKKYQNGEDYEFNPNVDPKNAFFMHTYPEIPNSAHNMLALQNADAESLTGVKAFTGASGISGSALGDSVGGIKSALDATAKRELGILRRLAQGIIEVGRKFISMNSEFLSDTEVVRITNEKFVEIRRDDLAGKFDLKLTISTAEADEQKASELAFMLQTMGNNMDLEMSNMILSEIATLRKMPALAKKIEEYEPQPDPLAVKKAELEIALLEAQIRTEQTEAMENESKARLNMAKAKAESSSADRDDLDFVEQESGVTQERDLEKASEQARGNMALEHVKHQFKMRENSSSKSKT